MMHDLKLKISGCNDFQTVHYLSDELYDLHKVVHGGFPWNNSTGASRKQHISDASKPAKGELRKVSK